MNFFKATFMQLAAIVGAGAAAPSARAMPPSRTAPPSGSSTGEHHRIGDINDELGRFESLESVEQLPTAPFARPDLARK